MMSQNVAVTFLKMIVSRSHQLRKPSTFKETRFCFSNCILLLISNTLDLWDLHLEAQISSSTSFASLLS